MNETISKIKAEIERLYGKYEPKYHETRLPYVEGLLDGFDLIEQFLDTLESEKPNNHEGLDEAAEEAATEVYTYTFQGMDDLIGLFKAGAKWDRNQMMKEAVEGDYDCQYMTPAVFLDKYLDGIKDGDKVRIIIVKED